MDRDPLERRGLFDGLRVPFDPNMLVLALACVVGFHATTLFLEWFVGAERILPRMVGEALGPWVQGLLGVGGYEKLSPVAWALALVVSLGFWSFFAAAINRVAAMMLAREETVGLKDAIRFASQKWLPTAGTILLPAVVMLGLYLVVNATVVGGLARIPYVGDLLLIGLYPVIMVTTFCIVLSGLLALLSLNIASSALATESSDTWDAISRSWTYVCTSPWSVLLVNGLTASAILIFALAGGKFMSVSVDSLTIGGWGAGAKTEIATVKGADLDDEIVKRILRKRGVETDLAKILAASGDDVAKERAKLAEQTFYVAVPGKGAFLRGTARGEYRWGSVPFKASEADVQRLVASGDLPSAKPEDAAAAAAPGAAVAPVAPPETLLNAASDLEPVGSSALPRLVADRIPWTQKLAGAVIWLAHWGCTYLLAALAFQYLLGAGTMLYFLLRKEVEGEDYAEIVVDEEEFDDEASWAIAAPGGVPSKGAPGQLIMPTTLKKDDAKPADGKDAPKGGEPKKEAATEKGA